MLSGDRGNFNCVYMFFLMTYLQAKMTALHLGVSGGHVETVKELAENADPSAINAIDGVS